LLGQIEVDESFWGYAKPKPKKRGIIINVPLSIDCVSLK
jgi:hypothetical protein